MVAPDLASPAVAAPAPMDAPERVGFTGDRAAFLSLVLKGSLLLIPTFGVYRFWLATDVRRRLWSATRIGNDGLEWTGTGRELLVGFLIALAVLAPIYFGYFLAGLAAESVQAFASVPFGLLLYLLGHYAAFRARRYRATRTILRGLRFWMTGSGLAYVARASLWDLLTLLSLGLAYPWRAAALEDYKMRHTHYGTLPGGFAGAGWAFFKRGWLLWLAGMVGLAALAGAVALAALAEFGQVSRPLAVAGLMVAGLFALLLLTLALPAFVGIEARWWLEGVRFGPVTAVSDLRAGRIVGRYWKLFGALLAYLLAGGTIFGLVAVAGGGAVQRFVEGGGGAAAGLVVGLVLGYLLFIAGFGAIKRRVLDFGLWEAMATSVTLHGLEALDEVVARGAPVSSLGEGLADALDVGGF